MGTSTFPLNSSQFSSILSTSTPLLRFLRSSSAFLSLLNILLPSSSSSCSLSSSLALVLELFLTSRYPYLD
ncbi:hypothetical protein FJTKL_00441 [Diaporthe vaccinii]|uniref:Uncharacterized protein n=1 Tax=Diaporthe vaccinii TaxID=105482 RepID=A0ABR4E2Z8_9PEZI